VTLKIDSNKPSTFKTISTCIRESSRFLIQQLQSKLMTSVGHTNLEEIFN